MTHRGLTPRQREVLDLLVEGKSDDEIGAALGIAEGTVAKHLAGAAERAGLHGVRRVQLAVWWHMARMSTTAPIFARAKVTQ